MAVTATVAIVAGSIMQAGSQVGQGAAAQASANANARNAQDNAKLALQKGKEDERKFRMQVRMAEGSNRAALGASGITLEGSALDALQNNAVQSEIDALQIRHGADNASLFLMRDASISRMGGRAAARAGSIGAAGTLLSAGGSVGLLNASGKSTQLPPRHGPGF